MTAPATIIQERLQHCAQIWRAFVTNQNGAAAVEYAVLASAIAIGVAAGVVAFGVALKTGVYDRIASIFS